MVAAAGSPWRRALGDAWNCPIRPEIAQLAGRRNAGAAVSPVPWRDPEWFRMAAAGAEALSLKLGAAQSQAAERQENADKAVHRVVLQHYSGCGQKYLRLSGDSREALLSAFLTNFLRGTVKELGLAEPKRTNPRHA